MAEGVLLRFANEEMVYLLRALQISDFPGLAADPLQELSDEQKSLLMQVADHTLRARGLVHWRGESERAVDPLVSNVLLQGARPAYTLFVDMLEANAATAKRLYIFGSEVVIEQSEPEPQVQQYLVMPTREAVAQRLHALIPEQQAEQTESLAGGQLDEDRWTETLKLARGNESAARTLLRAQLPTATADALAAALRHSRRILYLARWQSTPVEHPHPQKALTLVADENRLLLLWQEEPGSSALDVLSASVEQVREYVSRLIPQ